MAPQGAKCFLEGRILLHPTAALIVWLAAVLATQHLGYAGLVTLALLLILIGWRVAAVWWRYLLRSRWLLLALWLILAYNTPGDAWLELPWAPTLEGVHEASLQALRLMNMLGALAWLFGQLGRDGMVQALWGLFQPLADGNGGLERLVVRLSLVFSNLDRSAPTLTWRQMLAGEAPGQVSGAARISLRLPPWRWRDRGIVLAAGCVLCGVLWT